MKSADLFYQLEQDLLKNVAEFLGHGQALPGSAAWKLEKLAQMNALHTANIRTLARLAGVTEDAVRAEIRAAGYDAIAAMESDIAAAQRAGAVVNPVLPAALDPVMRETLHTLERLALDKLNLVNSSLIPAADKLYQTTIDKAVQSVLMGIDSPTAALRRAVQDWAARGLSGFTDAAGRQWTAEAYSNVIMRSTVRNVTTQMQFARMDQLGSDLIEVSSHMGARPKCRPYQGRVFSRNGKDKTYPPFASTSYGEADGLLGINCRHEIYPFFKGISIQRNMPYNAVANDQAYKESQQQRALERNLRAAKREVETYKALGDGEALARAKARLAQGKQAMAAFIDRTGRTRRGNREILYAVSK